MARIYLLLLLAAPFLLDASAAVPRIERGNLIFDGIPEPTAGLTE